MKKILLLLTLLFIIQEGYTQSQPIEYEPSANIIAAINSGDLADLPQKVTADCIANFFQRQRTCMHQQVPVSVFPKTSALLLNFEKEDTDNWTFALYNALGQEVYQKPVVKDGKINLYIVLDASIDEGLHYFTMTNKRGIVVAKDKLLLAGR